MVYNGKDGVFSVSEGESCDQVHGYLFKGSSIRRDCDSVEWGFLSMSDNLVLLTNGASFNIISNPLIHCWPLIELFCFSDRFVLAWMSSCHVIVSMCHDRS